MPHLYPHLRISQIFGGERQPESSAFKELKAYTDSANTDVGKTLLTTALIRATASKYAAESSSGPSKRVFYLKPVSTGPDAESDVR